MPSYTGLYFPFINFRGGDDWVKLSVLYWDEMWRIVPRSDTPRNTEVVNFFEQNGGIGGKRGFINSLNPAESGAAITVGRKFAEFLIDNEKELKKKYDVRSADKWEDAPPEWTEPTFSEHRKFARVYMDKLVPELREALQLTDLAKSSDTELLMHPELAHIIMTCLAEEIARTRGLSPTTDNYLCQIAVNGFTPEKLASILLESPLENKKRRETEVEMATLAIESFAPNFQKMSPQQILEFKEEHQSLLVSYRNWMHKVAKEKDWLDGIEDNETFQERLQGIYRQEMEGELENLEKLVRNQTIKTAVVSLGITFAVPSLLSVAGNTFGFQLDETAAKITGAALGYTKVLIDSESETAKLNKENGAFLVRLRNRDTPKGVVERIKNYARKLM